MKVEEYGSFVSSDAIKENSIYADNGARVPILSDEDKNDVVLYGAFEEFDAKSRKKLQKKRAKLRKIAEKNNKKEYSRSLKQAFKNAKLQEKALRKQQKLDQKNEAKMKKNALYDAMEESASGQTVKAIHSISTKLILIISVIIIISMGLITALVSYFISTDTQISAEENNLTINSRTASDCENQILSIMGNGGLLFELYSADKDDALLAKKNSRLIFDKCRDIAGIAFVNNDQFFVNEAFFIKNEIDSSIFKPYVLEEEAAVEKAQNGSVSLENPSPIFQVPLIAIFAPVYAGSESDVAVILFSSEAMGENFSSGSINSSILLNDNGTVLVHPDVTFTMAGENLSSKYLVQQMNSTEQDNRQLRYTDENGIEYFGAYNKLKGLNAGVITDVETAVIFEAVRSTTRRNIYLTVALLAMVILVIRFFAKSISNPLELLTEIAHHISQGNFDTPLFDSLKLGRKDEVGVLNRSTKDEQEILNTVTSLTNRGVTKAIVRKTIDFEPHLKDITIFFSDIRGFTAISDGFNNRFGEKSAGEIISFLNDYMSRMVACISATGGNVDKFEGDAIMACWGVLRDDDLSYEQMEDCEEKQRLEALHKEHRLHDMISAIRSTIGMRYALMKYNKDAKAFTEAHANEPLAQYKPYIKIGCGLNCGRATVGFMGSTEKMEFTSIGDAVNMASRTESSNKPCGTDILITQEMYDALKMDYIRCEENNYTIYDNHIADELIVEQIPVTFEVKGKGKQHFYGVVNMPQFNIEKFFKRSDENFVIDEDCKKACGPDGPKTLNEVREMLGIPIPDFGGVNLDAEENKVKIS